MLNDGDIFHRGFNEQNMQTKRIQEAQFIERDGNVGINKMVVGCPRCAWKGP